MTEKFERTFSVAVPIDRAWAAFTDSDERSRWEASEYEIDARPGGTVRWVLPGIEATGRVEEVEPMRRLRQAELTGPHAGSEITVTFEEGAEGTRISITYAGFGSGDNWDEWLEGTSLGWSQAIADLIVYLEAGVPATRFVTRMQHPGMTTTETDAGVVVLTVTPGGLADQAGVVPGDLVLRVGGVPVFTIGELWVLMREHPLGTRFEIEYIRGTERRRGAGVLRGASFSSA
jgi:uncharacterized protein YndB with AHSA1/START domain